MTGNATAPKGPLAAVMRWARGVSLTAVPIFGAVLEPMPRARLHDVLGSTFGLAPGTYTTAQADLLVVIGHVTHKLAPVLQRIHGGMADPSLVVQIAVSPPEVTERYGYALALRLDQIIPVDVVVPGVPPQRPDMERGLQELTRRALGRRSQR